jgi:hypothetical protein
MNIRTVIADWQVSFATDWVELHLQGIEGFPGDHGGIMQLKGIK